MKKNYFLLGLFVGLFLPTMSLGQEYELFLLKGKPWKYDFDNNNEKNVINKDQVTSANTKGWEVLDQHGDNSVKIEGNDPKTYDAKIDGIYYNLITKAEIAEVATGDEALTDTGISNIKAQASDAPYYDLNGQRIAQPKKGIYIQNGKKVIVR